MASSVEIQITPNNGGGNDLFMYIDDMSVTLMMNGLDAVKVDNDEFIDLMTEFLEQKQK